MVTEQKWGKSLETLSNLEVGMVSGFGMGSLEGDPSISCVQQNSELLGVVHSLSIESSTKGMPYLDISNKSMKYKLETSIYCASHMKSEGIDLCNDIFIYF